MNKLSGFVLLVSVLIFPRLVTADCADACSDMANCPETDKSFRCEEWRTKCDSKCEEKADPYGDDLFTGTKFQSGGTTIISGERIAAPISAFEGGHLTPEDLAPFEKSVVYSKGAHGTVSYSKTSSQDSFLNHQREEETREANVRSGLSVSTRKNSSN